MRLRGRGRARTANPQLGVLRCGLTAAHQSHTRSRLPLSRWHMGWHMEAASPDKAHGGSQPGQSTPPNPHAHESPAPAIAWQHRMAAAVPLCPPSRASRNNQGAERSSILHPPSPPSSILRWPPPPSHGSQRPARVHAAHRASSAHEFSAAPRTAHVPRGSPANGACLRDAEERVGMATQHQPVMPSSPPCCHHWSFSFAPLRVSSLHHSTPFLSLSLSPGPMFWGSSVGS